MGYLYSQYLADQETADTLGFVENYMHTPYTVAAKVCNGIGPSWFPQHLRELVSKLNPSLVVVAQNHDLGYYYGRGTASNFRQLNEAFRINGRKVAEAKYGWYDPRRYWVEFQAWKFAKECDKFGWKAYAAAINERKAAQEGKTEEADV